MMRSTISVSCSSVIPGTSSPSICALSSPINEIAAMLFPGAWAGFRQQAGKTNGLQSAAMPIADQARCC
jgi:hypothetical protein